MNDAILIFVPNQVGGVANVAGSLADGLESNGRCVIRASSARQLIGYAFRHRPRYAILSLGSGFLSFLFRKKIYIVHGFPVRDSYGLLRRLAVNAAAHTSRLFGSRIVAVSHLTKAVTSRIFGLSVDAVIWNGVKPDLHSILMAAKDNNEPKSKLILFLGRIILGKGIESALHGFLASNLIASGYRLVVAGGGPALEDMRRQFDKCKSIEFRGVVSEEEKAALLVSSDILVSLNDFEPMGVVFAEAVLARCKIVAPYCGGHNEFVPREHPLFQCDPSSVESVASAMNAAAGHIGPASFSYEAAKIFDYEKHIAPRYGALLES